MQADRIPGDGDSVAGDEPIELSPTEDARDVRAGEADDTGLLQFGAGSRHGFRRQSEIAGRVGTTHRDVDLRGMHLTTLLENVEKHRRPMACRRDSASN